MIEPLRQGILAVEGAADNIEEELLNDEKQENEVSTILSLSSYQTVMCRE